MTVKDIQGVLFGICEWRIYDKQGHFDKSVLTYAYNMRFELGYANYTVSKIDSGARTDGLTVVQIWPPRS